MGAPSLISEQYSTGTSDRCLEIILPVSVALVIVEYIIRVIFGKLYSFSLAPVKSACSLPTEKKPKRIQSLPSMHEIYLTTAFLNHVILNSI